MYRHYWKLKELPFENTPDPRFFYPSGKHQEALARLQYLVRQRRACGVLTGVYGCGKTLVIHALKKSLETEGVRFSFVTNPRLDDLGMLRLLLRGLTQTDVPAQKADVLIELEKYVTAVAHDGKHSVLIVDEAQDIMDETVFEELRLLMNFQTETRCLVTLLLVGQPELKARIEGNKQLNQRVALRFHLDAFDEEETKAYILHRLAAAGGGQPFTDDALALMHQHSGGIPRWINHYAHMSLLTGFSQEAALISPEIVAEAVQSLAGAV